MATLPLKPDYTIDDLPKIGITRYGFIKTTDIIFDPQALKLCASNACRKYGKFWTCSPGSGPLEQSKATCLSYSDALVFCSVYELEDSYDVEGMARGGTEFRNVCDRFYDLLTPPFKLLSTGGCHLCKTCTYPDAPCRFPDRMSPSISSYGIIAANLAESAGMPYINGENTVTYFGLLCFGKA